MSSSGSVALPLAAALAGGALASATPMRMNF
jgi:hypothetical protein